MQPDSNHFMIIYIERKRIGRTGRSMIRPKYKRLNVNSKTNSPVRIQRAILRVSVGNCIIRPMISPGINSYWVVFYPGGWQ